MARKGLPAKYAKMGFSRGWKAYRAASGKTKRSSSSRKRRRTKTRTASARKSTASYRRPAAATPARRSRRRRSFMPRFGIPRRPAKSTIQLALNTGIAAGGAIGSAALVRALPIANAKARAASQLAIGALTLLMAKGRARMLRLAGVGATMAGALAVTREVFPQFPVMAGYSDRLALMGSGWKDRVARDPRLTAFNSSMSLSAPRDFSMGMPTSRFSSGYGGKFATAANM